MDFQTSVRTCLTRKYAAFQGRASRSEYWWFVLAYVIGMIVVAVLPIPLLPLLYVLALILPLAAAGFRRLQDTGRPGWYIFVPIALSVVTQFAMPRPGAMMPGGPGEIPTMTPGAMGGYGLAGLLALVQIVVTLLFIWWLTRPSDPAANAYGPPPVA
ncbi:MAG: DUF805 domain-containing protein [Rhodobacteraceae bacterium]|jgi:uncharacterized membrane protein YhaH (DUF805 family)|nr:DUF805 domain-containing protein [Paracoccaceae bacterium]